MSFLLLEPSINHPRVTLCRTIGEKFEYGIQPEKKRIIIKRDSTFLEYLSRKDYHASNKTTKKKRCKTVS